MITGGSYSQTVVGTATPTIYGYLDSWNTTSVPDGTYTLQSLATDAAGNSAYSSGIAITVNNPPPSTAVVIPSTGASVQGASALLGAVASASNGVKISKVQFVITGGSYSQTVVGTATPTIYGYLDSWNTTSVPDGTYTLQSLATDAAGNSAYSSGIAITVNNPPPSTAVVIPSTGASVQGASALLGAVASASNGVKISKVQFVITGGSYSQTVVGTATPTIYGYLDSWNTTSVPDGTYTLQSLATDAAGNSAYSSGIAITVAN